VRALRPLSGIARRLRHPRTTVRWRLTLLYGGLFLVSGAALLAITYTLVDNAVVFPQSSNLSFVGPGQGFHNQAALPNFNAVKPSQRIAKRVPPPIAHLLRTRQGAKALGELVVTQRVADMHQLIIESALALAVMALISTALGWVVAGRVLRPLRTMTAAAQEISEENLNRRLAMQGPRDELRQLADTIDGLLGRLEGAFDAQRRFVANASHELRTPLTAVRALLEMVLADPTATVTTFRATCEQVLEESEQQEQLIEALLTLAQGQRGIADAHDAQLAVRARPGGGLVVEVDFPARATPPPMGAAPVPLSVEGQTTISIG
jgi:signal transduction histidine kinase